MSIIIVGVGQAEFDGERQLIGGNPLAGDVAKQTYL